jgi:hypothetical protein
MRFEETEEKDGEKALGVSRVGFKIFFAEPKRLETKK